VSPAFLRSSSDHAEGSTRPRTVKSTEPDKRVAAFQKGVKVFMVPLMGTTDETVDAVS
jgi:hypothetical protein